MVDPRNAKLLAGRIPGAQLVIFPELGHLLSWQDPDGFDDVVTSFLLARGNINDHETAVVIDGDDMPRDRSSGRDG